MPNRLIKSSIHDSEKVNQMTDFQFRVWVNLITYVDDYGRGDARPAIIKGNCFPLRERLTTKDIEAALKALADIGCVSLYEVDGKPYLCLPNWESHQNVRNKKSRYPAPTASESEKEADSARLQAIEINCNQLNANVPVIQSNPNPNTKTRTREAVIGIDGTDLTEQIERAAVIDDMIRRYTLPDNDYSRQCVAEDLETFGEERLTAALEEAAQSNTRGRNVSVKYYRAILNGTGLKREEDDGIPWIN